MSAVLELNELVPQTQVVSQRRLITVAEYDRMTELGFFENGERVELLNGEIIKIMGKGTKHAILNDLVVDIFKEKLGENVYVRNQNPIVLDNLSEPEPDIVLVKPPRAKYLDAHPRSSDIYLVMEISDPTLYQDRETKSLAYARAEIQQYCLFNVNKQTIEDYREPSSDGYQFKQTLKTGDRLGLVAFPDVEIRINEILSSNA